MNTTQYDRLVNVINQINDLRSGKQLSDTILAGKINELINNVLTSSKRCTECNCITTGKQVEYATTNVKYCLEGMDQIVFSGYQCTESNIDKYMSDIIKFKKWLEVNGKTHLFDCYEDDITLEYAVCNVKYFYIICLEGWLTDEERSIVGLFTIDHVWTSSINYSRSESLRSALIQQFRYQQRKLEQCIFCIAFHDDEVFVGTGKQLMKVLEKTNMVDIDGVPAIALLYYDGQGADVSDNMFKFDFGDGWVDSVKSYSSIQALVKHLNAK